MISAARFPVLISCVALLSTLSPVAHGATVLDQQYTTGTGGVSGNHWWGQTFKPSFNNVAAVAFEVQFTYPSINPDTRLRVRLLDAPGGNELRSGSVDLPDGSVQSWIQVSWTPVFVVPEQEYFLEIAPGNQLGFGSGSNYTRGQHYHGGSGAAPVWQMYPNGVPSTYDMEFRTYSDDAFSAPTPAAAGLALPLLCTIGMMRRRR